MKAVRLAGGVVRGILFGGTLYTMLVVVFLITLPIRWRPTWVKAVTIFAARIAVPLCLFFGGIRVRVAGREWLAGLGDGPRLLVSNHASNLDPLALMTLLGRYDLSFVAKAETLRRPLFGGLLKAVGWFAVERENLVSLKRFQEEVKARAKTGWTPELVIFPEGTRTRDGKLQPMRLGTFLLAAQMRAPIVPIVIRGTYPLHKRNAFLVFPGTVRVDVMPPIYPPAGKIDGHKIVDAAGDLQKQTEAVFRAVPDLTKVRDDLAVEAAPAPAVAEVSAK